MQGSNYRVAKGSLARLDYILRTSKYKVPVKKIYKKRIMCNFCVIIQYNASILWTSVSSNKHNSVSFPAVVIHAWQHWTWNNQVYAVTWTSHHWVGAWYLNGQQSTQQTKSTTSDDNSAQTAASPTTLGSPAGVVTAVATCSSGPGSESGHASLPFNWTRSEWR